VRPRRDGAVETLRMESRRLADTRPRTVATMTIDDRLRELGIDLPASAPPAGAYVPAVLTGNLLFLSGHGPARPEGGFVTGKVGRDVDLEAAKHAARLTGLQLLAAMRTALGSLDRVTRVVKILGMVNGTPGFNQTPQVIDGCSELFIEVFGEKGRGARSAVGLAELPFDLAVELEAIVEVSL
jgi:enamine deaminase RidA (YjgF/YER057c/UK114 family)